MELIKYGIKKHPHLTLFAVWLYTFLLLGRFQIDGAVLLNYASPVVFAAILIVGELLFIKHRGFEEKKIERDIAVTAAAALGVTAYMLIMLRVFSRVPSMQTMQGRNAVVPFFFGATALIGAAVWVTIKKKWTYERAVIMIFAVSFVFHVFFMLYNGLIYQRDGGQVAGDGTGHLGYMEYIHDNLSLPQFDPRERWQYYHPPLNHIIGALFFKLQTVFGADIRIAVYNITYLPLLYMMNTLILFGKLSAELGLRRDRSIIVLAICAFSPAFFCMGLYINNDMLSVMLMMLSLLLSLKWYKKRTVKNIAKVALSFGLSMLAKLSAWLIAVPIAVIFIAALAQELKKKDFRAFFGRAGQMGVFLGIAAPLSLYWSIRNLVRFGVPISYIPVGTDLTQVIPQPSLQRIFDFDISQFSVPWAAYVSGGDGFNEYNPLIALIKTSSAVIRDPWYINYPLLIITIVLCAASFVCMIYVLFREKKLSLVNKLVMGSLYLIVMASYYVFCLKYPHVCTEEIRYASPVIFIGAFFLAWETGRLRDRKRFKWLKTALTAAVVLFSVASLVMVAFDGIWFSLYLNMI